MSRREHGRILGDVLDNLNRIAAEQDGRANLAGLAAGANLPHDRLVTYLAELRQHGLITEARFPLLTPKGDQFLDCYRSWRRIQAIYGLEEVQSSRTGILIGLASAMRNWQRQ